MNLDFTTWKEFRLGDLFEIKKGKRLTSEDQIDGNTPYIGAIDSNNGISNYIEQEPIHQGNTISLSYNGSVGEAFYQPNPFWATDDVNVLYFRNENGVEFNMHIAMFICTVLRQEKYRYCYGRKWVLDSMKGTKILLPSKSNMPDWSWMEAYIKSLNCKSITTENVSKNVFLINVSEWKEFEFGSLIDKINIYKAKAHSKVELESAETTKNGYIHFVSRTETNNGIDCYVLETDVANIENGNAITIGDTTSTIAYQSEKFVAGDHMIVIRADWLNKYTGLFIVNILRKERFRYSYGRAFLMDSIKSTKLMLPVKRDIYDIVIDKDKEHSEEGYVPDWEYMENYIKSLPYGDRI